jgi:hypothetical protein
MGQLNHFDLGLSPAILLPPNPDQNLRHNLYLAFFL